MSKVKKEEVRQIAYLARLNISKKEEAEYQSDLSDILDYVELINKADISGTQPMVNVTCLFDVVRSDIKKPSSLTRDEIILNAPEKKEGYIKVKPVLE